MAGVEAEGWERGNGHEEEEGCAKWREGFVFRAPRGITDPFAFFPAFFLSFVSACVLPQQAGMRYD